MKTVITYPLPFDAWAEFEQYVRRFATTFRQHPPGADYELYAICHWGEPTDEVRSMFYGIKTRFTAYYRNGADLGGAQELAETLDDCFMVNMTSRCYFHRTGWLARFMEAREIHRQGLYGVSASFEHLPHICTRAYALDCALFREWTKRNGEIRDRQDGPKFETSKNSITQLTLSLGLPAVQVLWDSEQLGPKHWREPENIFRRGNQEQCLCWDKHTDIYRDADADQKAKLEKLTDPP